jgi:uncharacterized membrane protein YfcA
VTIATSLGDGAASSMQKVVGAALIAGGLGFAVKTFVKGHDGDGHFDLTRRQKVLAILIGAVGGFVVGLTSVGSGTWFGLAMLFTFPLTARRMVGTDMLHAALLLWVAGAGHLLHGNVDLHAIGWLLIGSIPGVLLGSHLSIRVPEQGLRIAFAFVLFLSGVKLVGMPAATTIIEVGVAIGVIVFAGWSIVELRGRRAAIPSSD